MRRISKVMLGLGLVGLLGAGDALAIIGRPLTPLSYAGVARRTTRRAVYGTAAVGTAAVVGGAAVATAATVATLPPSCTTVMNAGVSYRQCGSSWYQPAYEGPNMVYQTVPPPY